MYPISHYCISRQVAKRITDYALDDGAGNEKLDDEVRNW